MAQADVLTENTKIENQSSNLIGEDSYTYDGDNKKYDLTIDKSTNRVYDVATGKTLSFKDVKNLTISNTESRNEDAAFLYVRGKSGGWHVALDISDNQSVNIQDNKQVIDDQSASNKHGGGIFRIYNSCVDMNNNGSISFIGNEVNSTKNHTNAPNSMFVYESSTTSSWTYEEAYDTFDMNNNGNVIFQANKLIHEQGAGYGGAMKLQGACDLNKNFKGGAYYCITTVNWMNNTNVSFDGNILKTKTYAHGGALHLNKVNHTISGITGTVSFNNNMSSSDTETCYGGAIYVDDADTRLNIVGNNKVEFKGNTAIAKGDSAKAMGGVIYSYGNKQILKINNNVNVLFSGNGVIHETKDSDIKGGAIYGGFTTEICNNKEVIFEKNYEKGANNILLRSIYVEGGDLKLSAAEGGHMTFNDTIKVASKEWSGWYTYEPGERYAWIGHDGSDIQYNGYKYGTKYAAGEYGGNLILNEGEKQTGKIVFSGKHTQTHLEEIAKTEITNADVITASRTSVVEGTVTLYAGTLSLQDDAVLQATELIVKDGATLEAVRTDDVAAVVFSLGAEEAALLSPAATLAAGLVLEEGAIVNLEGGNISLGGKNLKLNGMLNITLSSDMLGEDKLVLFSNVNAVDGDVSELVVNGVTTTGNFSEGNVIIDVANVPNIPEPTTATLSLLALAGLAMRRRRR